MSTHQHPYGKPENVLGFAEDSKVFVRDEPLRQMFLHPDVKHRKIVAFSIIGAYRNGKSFFLNYCLRYLYAHYPSINFPNNPISNPDDWIGDKDEPLSGFSWRSGSVRDTTGLEVWNDVFLHTDETSGQEIAIFVMDTHGLFDKETSSLDNSRIFTLDTLISSIQIFNMSGAIQDDNQLQYLQFAVECAKFACNKETKKETKSFQKLMFLIRDWEHMEKFCFGIEGGKKYWEHSLRTSDGLFSSYEDVSCALLPHPGKAVRKEYNGSWGKIDEDYKEELVKLIDHLLRPENLVVKKVDGNVLNGEEFYNYVYSNLKRFQTNELLEYQSIRDSMIKKEMKTTKPIEETDETISINNKITLLEKVSNEPLIQEFGILEESNTPNLLLLACKEGRLKDIQNFLKHGLDIDYEDEDKLNAVDNIWINYRDSKREDEKDKYEKIILSLIKANSKNPSKKVKFNIDIAPSMVRNLIEICESLHRYVEHDEEKNLLAEIKNHPNLRYFYDRNNESLLLFTLKLHKINFIKIFDGALSIGRNESLNEVFYKYSKKRHNTILGSAEEKLPNPHIIILKSKSIIFNMSDQNHTNWKYIENAFNKLDENEVSSRVLRIAAPYKNLKIYFDFQKDVNFNPNQGTDNKTSFESGIIYIGAKDLNGENEAVLSALISQLCNIAIHLSCLDYYDPNMADDFEEEEPADKNPNLQEDNLGDDKEQATKQQLVELIKKTLNDHNIHLYDYFIMLDIHELLDIIDILQDEEQFIDYDGLTQPMKMKILHSKIIFQDVETSLYHIVGNNLDVLNVLTSEDIRNVLLRNIKLEIGESRKAFNKHKIIDRELIQSNIEDDTLAKCEKIKYYKQIKADVEESKNFILSDVSGTGKTVKFGDLKRKLKEDSKNVWISFIKLRDHKEMLTKYKSEEDKLSLDAATQILLDILNIKSEVEIEIFKILFHDGKVILLLDGFDEIDQTLKDFWMKIKSLLNKKIEKIQFWISTRPPPSKVLLENTNGKPYKFAPLTLNDKNKIIIDTLAELNFCNKSDEVPQNLRIFIDLVEHHGQFSIDNPLMLRIIVEIFAENQADFEPEAFNFFTIFERVFIKQKAKFDEKTDNKNFSLFEKFPASKVHQVYGLKLVFGKMNNQNQNNLAIMKMWSREQRRWTSERIQQHGFLSVDLEDKTDNEGHPVFIHKSYADFFAVKYIISYMFSEDCSINEAEFKKIFELLRIIASSYDEYQNVQKLILGFIKCNDCTFHSEMSNIFSNNITLIANNITSSENSTKSKFWREIFNKDYEILQKLDIILNEKINENSSIASDVLRNEDTENIMNCSKSGNNLQFSDSRQLEPVFNNNSMWESFENLQQLPMNNLDERLIKINDNYIIKLTNENSKFIVERNARQNCKILQISSELDIDQKLSIISTLEPSEYPNLFILIIENQDDNFLTEGNGAKARKLEEILTKFGAARPLIIQLSIMCKNCTKFYYKDENSNHIVDIVQNYFEDYELYERWQNILTSYLDQELQSFEDDILKKLSCLKNNSIILRFLRTFNMEETFFATIVLEIAENGSKAELLAVLDASFEENGRMLNSQAQDYIQYVFEGDESGSEDDEDQHDPKEGTSSQTRNKDSSQSILLAAVENKNKEVINYLITYWTHLIQQLPFDHQVRISTSAFETNQLDVLCDLLDISDFPFPEYFTITKSRIDDKLFKITEERMELKPAIEREDYEKICSFIERNLSNNKIYNINNNSALKEAVKARKFGVFYYLKSLGFQGESCQDVINNLGDEEKKQAINQAMRQKKSKTEKILQSFHKSVLHLSARSLIHNRKISKEQEIEYRNKIRSWFKDIQKIAPEMLDVAASCEHLKVIFDFESNFVEYSSLTHLNSEGVADTTSKWIFIRAKFTDKASEQKIKGVLGHELCHYVMGMAYDNHGFPYYKGDKRTEGIFKEIIAIIDKWSITKDREPDDECDGIISTSYRLYKSKDIEPELIASVIHILVNYDDNSEKSNLLRGMYKILFDFWYNHVVPEMRNYLKKDMVVIRVNTTVKLLSSLSKSKIEFNGSRDMEQLIKNEITIVNTNVPRLLLINVCKYLQENLGCLLGSQNIFLEPVNIMYQQVWKDLMDLNARDVKLNIFVDCTKGHLDNLSHILNIKEFKFILITSNKEQLTKVNDICSRKEKINPTVIDIKYNWSDLTEESQMRLIQSNVVFQNNPEISLMELLSKNKNPDQNEVEKLLEDFSNIINDQVFNILIDRQEVSINSNVEDSNKKKFEILFQNRNFLKKGISFKNKISQEKLISITENNKYILISDIAGSGKSWVVKNISNIIMKQNPTRWVTYVDLKQFIEKFRKQTENFEFANYFVENILKPKTKFEVEIFKKLYEIGKVSIIFDAFDEIVPDCAEYVANLTKSFEFNDGNQLWIVTRDYYEVPLQDELEINIVYKLNEFTEEDGVNFIVTSWILMDLKDQAISNFDNCLQNSPNLTKYQQKAKKIVQKVTMSKNQSVGLPQLFSMIADGFKDDKMIIDDLKGAKIFTQFVNTMYTRWADFKGILRKQASVQSQDYELNFKELHQFVAILSLFPELVDTLFPDYDISEWPEVEIIAGGLLNKIDSSYSFNYDMFREYFVADFIFKALKKPRIKKEIVELLVKLLTIQKYGIIRMFLNDFIDNYFIMERVQLELEKSVDKFSNMENLSEYFTENLGHLAKLVIEILKKGDNEKVRKILSDNISAVATKTKEFKMFSMFTEFLFSYLRLDDLKEMINQQNILHKIIGADSGVEIFEYFELNLEAKTGREFIEQELKLMPPGNENGNILYHLGSSENLSEHKFQKCFEIFHKYLFDREIVELMDECTENGETILEVLVKNTKNFKPFLESTDSILTNQNLHQKFKNIVKKTNSSDKNILHWSAAKEDIDFHISMWKLIEKTFESREELRSFILQKDESENNFIHLLVIYNTASVIEFILQKLKENISESNYQEILRSKGQNERNLLQLAAIYSKEVKSHQILWKELKDSCKSDEEFLEILGEVDKEGILNLAAAFTTSEVLEFMISEMEKIASSDEIRNLLIKLGHGNRNLLQAAAGQNKSLELHKILWKILQMYFSSTEMLEFVKHLDSIGENLLIIAQKFNTKEILKLTFTEIKKVVKDLCTDTETGQKIENCEKIIQKLAKTTDDENDENEGIKDEENELLKLDWIKNPNSGSSNLFDEFTQQIMKSEITAQTLKDLMPIVSNRNVLYHEIFWDNLLQTFENRQDLAKIFLEKDKDGNNFIQLLVIYNTADVIKFTLKKLKENLGESDYLEILRSKGQNERNLLQLAAIYSKEVKTHQLLWTSVRDSCKSDQEFFEIHREADKYGDNVLSLSVAFSSNDLFKLIFGEIEKAAFHDEIIQMLKCKNLLNQSLLQTAIAQNKCIEHYRTLWNILQKYLKSTEIIEMIKHVDCHGNNLLINILDGTNEIKDFTWNEVKTILKNDGYLDKEYDEKINQCEEIIQKFSKSAELNLQDKEHLKMNWIWSVKTFKDLTPFAFAKNYRKHEILWNHLLKTFDDYIQLENLLIEKNEDGNSFIHLLVIYNTASVIEFTLQKLKENTSESNYQKNIKSKGQFGRNLLQLAAYHSKEVKTHQLLWTSVHDSCKSDEEFLEILTEVDKEGDNVLNLAAAFTTSEIFGLLIAEMEKIASSDEIRFLLSSLSGRGNTNLLQSVVINNQSLETYKIAWKIICKYFKPEEILKFIEHYTTIGNNLLYCAVYYNTKEIVEFTWYQIKNFIITEDAQVEYLNKKGWNGQDLFQMSLENQKKDPQVPDWVQQTIKLFGDTTKFLMKQKISVEALKDLMPFISDENVENHDILWENMLEIYTNSTDLKKFLSEKNEYGNNFIHLLIIYNTADVIEFTLQKIKENLSESDYHDILRSKGEFGTNLLQVAARNSRDVKTHQILWTSVRYTCKSDDEFLETIRENNESGSDVFSFAAAFTTSEILEFMEKELEKIAPRDKIRNLLIKLGVARNNLLQTAAGQNKSLELHKTLWITLQKYFSSSEILEFVTNRDIFGDNLLKNAIEQNTKEVVGMTWNEVKTLLISNVSISEKHNTYIEQCEEILKSISEPNQLKRDESEILKLKWIKNENSESSKLFDQEIQRLVEQNLTNIKFENLNTFMADENPNNHEKLWENLIEIYKIPADLKRLLSEKDKDGNNFIHLLVIYNTADVIKFTLKKLKENLGESDYQEILRSKGQNERNLLQLAAIYSKAIKFHQLLWTSVRDSCKSDEKFLEIIGQIDEYGDNVLNLAAACTTGEILEFMNEALVKLKSRYKIRKLLIKLGHGNKNLLQAAAEQNKSLELHKMLWKILQKYFNPTEILEFIKHLDSIGENLLIIAKKCNTKEILELTWAEIKKNIKDLFTDTKIGQKIEQCESTIQKIAESKSRKNKEITDDEVELLKLDWIENPNSESSNLFDEFTQQILKSEITVQTLKDLMPIVKNRYVLNHEILWDHLLKTFENRQDLAKLLLEKDKDGNIFIHLIAIYNTANMIEFTLQKLKKILNESDYQDILRSKGQNGRDLLQLQSKQKKSNQKKPNQKKSIITKYHEKASELIQNSSKYLMKLIKNTR